MQTFGEKIKVAREQKSLLLRQVSDQLGIDQAIISKFERNERNPARDQVLKFAEYYKIDKDDLLVSWLSDKVATELGSESLAHKALKVAELKVGFVQKAKGSASKSNTALGKKTHEQTTNPNQELFKSKFYEGWDLLKNWHPEQSFYRGTADVLDFFSGCGGMSLGFDALRKEKFFNIIGGVDISEYALRTFARNFKAKTLKRDIREIYLNKEYNLLKEYFGIKEKRKRPLIIIGCAPCQGFSAHRKKNWHIEDERNTLIGAFAEVAVSFSPDYIVMENVPEILGEKYRQHYEEAKEIFEHNGYKISQSVYNAAGFGVPQARNRAIIVASKSDFSLPLELFSNREYMTVKNAISDLPKVKAGKAAKSDPFHRSASHKESTINTILQIPKNGGSRPKGVGPKCLDKVNGFSDVYGRLNWDKPSITITQYSRNPASGRFVHPVQDRGLTIREAARLQSFPDGFEYEGSLDECFKQIGEAVPPLLSLAIAAKIALDILNQKKIRLSDNQYKSATKSSGLSKSSSQTKKR